MKSHSIFFCRREVCNLSAGLVGLLTTLSCAEPAPWPSFRGPQGKGAVEGAATPREWDVSSGKNIRWKADVPGLGLSSPVIWGDKLFITTSVAGGEGEPEQVVELKTGLYGDIESSTDRGVHRYMVICYSVKTGEVLWKNTVHTGKPTIARHPKASHANSTCTVDAQHVVSCFGAEGLYCHDLDGKLLWKKDLGKLDSGYYQVPSAQWGYGSSPVIAGDRVLVQADVQQDGFLAAYALSDGKEIWRKGRKEVPTWSSPLIQEIGGRRQVIVNGYKHMGGYDYETGEELWWVIGGGDIPVPTPVAGHGMIFLTNAHGNLAPVVALKEDVKGNLADVKPGQEPIGTVWSVGKWGNYMQTPLLTGHLLFCCSDGGIVTCYEARTGENYWRERLPKGGYTASPVTSGGIVYFTGEEGDVQLIEAAKEYKLVATRSLGAQSMATPAIQDGALFFRTRNGLICVASP